MHLRWGFDPVIGYPAEGFRIYRREASGRPPVRCLTISPGLLSTVLQQGWGPIDDVASLRVSPAIAPGSQPNPGLTVPSHWRRFEVDVGQVVLLQRVGLQGVEGLVIVIGLLGGRPVSSRAVASGPNPTAVFALESVDTVVVYTLSGGPASVCFAEVATAVAGEWSPNLLAAPADRGEVGLGLPLTHPDYNLHHRFEEPPAPATGDLREAQARLDASGATIGSAEFDELRGSLALMVDERMPGRMFDREILRTADGATPFLERPLDLSLLFGLDPALARVLGLYVVDAEVVAGTAYDYLLVGRWAAWQLPEPARAYSFASVPEGTLVPRRFSLDGVGITLPTQARVTSEPRVDDAACRKALIVRARTSFRVSEAPATVRFAEPQRWVVLELGARREGVTVSAQRSGIELHAVDVPAGDEPATVLLDPAAMLTELEILGSDYVLYGLRALPASAPDHAPGDLEAMVNLGTMVLGVPFQDAPPLDPPSGLRLRGMAMATSEQPGPTLEDAEPPIRDDPQGLGLTWQPAPVPGFGPWIGDLGRRQPTEAAGYELRYQFLGNGAAADPTDPSRWVAASDGPVTVAPPASPGQHPGADPLLAGDDLAVRFPATAPPLAAEFQADADLWLVPWIAEGWYAAEVRAVDVFGRPSAWAAGGPTLVDNIPAPPPPSSVEAKLLQEDDPELAPDEHALVQVHGDGCIRVSWEWPVHARRQAPRGRNFRVYLNRRPFNSIAASVISVAPGPGAGELTCTVQTEEPLTTDGLADSTIVDRDRTAFRILANTAGSTANLTLRRHLVQTALEPGPGAAALVIQPGAPLYERAEQRAAWEARVAEVAIGEATRYEVIVPPSGITATRDTPVRHARVGLATADDSPRAPDTFIQPPGPPWDPSLGGLPGHEGGVSGVGIVARLFAPIPVAQPAPRDRLYTTRPDYFGRCTYELRWPHVGAGARAAIGWRVYRATDRAVFGLYHPDAARSRIDATSLAPADRAELDTVFPTGLAAAVSDDVIHRLASQPGADQAFTAADERRLMSTADVMVLVDGLDGRNTVRYLWRMRLEDDAGNLSPLGAPTQPVYVPNSYPPAEVEVAECRGGERAVRLSWIPNAEPDLAGYLVYATEDDVDADDLAGVRLLRRATGPESGTIEAYDRTGRPVPPVLDLTRAAADALLVDGLVVVPRSGLAAGRTFEYRFAAYDTAGNPSVLTRTYTARTTGIERPPHPAWGTPMSGPDGLQLVWTAPRGDLNCLLQRSVDGARWTNVGGWRGRGNYAAVDPRHVPGSPVRYRLRVMQPNGQINREFTVLEA